MARSLILVLCVLWMVGGTRTLTLTATNHLAIRGPIDADAASRFVYASQRTHAQVKYVYIDSPGGSVTAGVRMVEEMRLRNYTCVVDTAYSMAFALVQACTVRLVRASGTLMQHQISVSGVSGELAKVQARLRSIERVRKRLDQMQATRLQMTEETFVARIQNEWWMDAEEAIAHQCVDALAPPLQCSASLLQQTFKQTDSHSFGLFATATVHEYSSCPLVSEPLRQLASASVPVVTPTPGPSSRNV